MSANSIEQRFEMKTGLSGGLVSIVEPDPRQGLVA